MRVYTVEVEEVANVWYEVEADSPAEANALAARGLGTIIDRYTTSRTVVCEAELVD